MTGWNDDWATLGAALGLEAPAARKYLRQVVTLPDGRTITGRVPGASACTLEEHGLRDELARQLRGVTEAVLPYGRADVMTSRAVFEVEPYRSWRNGARQVLAYSAQCGLPPALALFGLISQREMINFWLKFREREPPVMLWWWDGELWCRVTSRATCKTMPRGAQFGTCRTCDQPFAVPPGERHRCS